MTETRGRPWRAVVRAVVPLRVRKLAIWRTAGPELARGLAGAGKAGLRFFYRSRPVPLACVLGLRRLVLRKDALLPPLETFVRPGSALSNSFLRSRLARDELGRWTLSAATLDFLEQEVRKLRPAAVLEFGSGISTVCLARYMQELRPDEERVRVCSVEERSEFAEQTREALALLGLDRRGIVVHAPLRRQVIEGKSTICYDLDPNVVREALAGLCPDFVLVDGPSSDEGRFGTLPLVRPAVSSRAQFYLDDALRDGELRDAQIWNALTYLQVEGYYLQGKGLLIGRMAGTC